MSATSNYFFSNRKRSEVIAADGFCSHSERIIIDMIAVNKKDFPRGRNCMFVALPSWFVHSCKHVAEQKLRPICLLYELSYPRLSPFPLLIKFFCAYAVFLVSAIHVCSWSEKVDLPRRPLQPPKRLSHPPLFKSRFLLVIVCTMWEKILARCTSKSYACSG